MKKDDETRIDNKIEEIEQYLQELLEIVPLDYEEYSHNFEKKAACERYFERIIEAAVDLAILEIKEKNLKLPEDDKQTFDILAENHLISEELAEKLKDAKGMRNILAHQYGKINDEIVFDSISEELISDVENFIKSLKQGLV